MAQEESRIISNTIFGLTLAVVILLLVGLFFPALVISQIYELLIKVDSFELGFWAMPVLTVNLILLGFGILYYKKFLPVVIYRLIDFILNFEVSRRTAIIVVVTLFVIYIGFSLYNDNIYEPDPWGDFFRIEKAIEEFPFNEYRGNVSIVYVQNFFLWVSQNILQNIRILPFVASISLLLLTYFFTVQLTNKRFAGIIALIVLMQSWVFLTYDTTATYSNFWALFYLLSLYLITNKRWYLSHVSFIASLLSKPLGATFLPMTMFFIYNAKMPRKKKIFSISIYGIIFGAIIAAALAGSRIAGTSLHSFDYGTFWMGFAWLQMSLRNDGFVLVFLLPLVVGLYIISRRGVTQADSILFLIMGTLLTHPLLVALTGFNILPYRFIPFLVFFAVGVGLLFSKKTTQPA